MVTAFSDLFQRLDNYEVFPENSFTRKTAKASVFIIRGWRRGGGNAMWRAAWRTRLGRINSHIWYQRSWRKQLFQNRLVSLQRLYCGRHFHHLDFPANSMILLFSREKNCGAEISAWKEAIYLLPHLHVSSNQTPFSSVHKITKAEKRRKQLSLLFRIYSLKVWNYAFYLVCVCSHAHACDLEEKLLKRRNIEIPTGQR